MYPMLNYVNDVGLRASFAACFFLDTGKRSSFPLNPGGFQTPCLAASRSFSAPGKLSVTVSSPASHEHS